MARRRLAEVIPIEAALPRGLFAPFLAPPCDHELVEGAPIELHGWSRPLPTRRCRLCPAIEVQP